MKIGTKIRRWRTPKAFRVSSFDLASPTTVSHHFETYIQVVLPVEFSQNVTFAGYAANVVMNQWTQWTRVDGRDVSTLLGAATRVGESATTSLRGMLLGEQRWGNKWHWDAGHERMDVSVIRLMIREIS